MATPYPWADPDATWYAALVSNGVPYNVVRRSHIPVPPGEAGSGIGIIDECIDLVNGTWMPAPGGATVFEGSGDGLPIDEAGALRLIARLAPGLVGEHEAR
jgi:hypothetical protein